MDSYIDTYFNFDKGLMNADEFLCTEPMDLDSNPDTINRQSIVDERRLVFGPGLLGMALAQYIESGDG